MDILNGMASSKQQPVTKKDLLVFMERVDKGFDAMGKHFKAIDKRFKEQSDKILGLQLDTQALKRGQREIIQEQRLVQDSLLALNERVKYQDYTPERVKQLENDTHQLKLEVHRIKERMSK